MVNSAIARRMNCSGVVILIIGKMVQWREVLEDLVDAKYGVVDRTQGKGSATPYL